MSPQAKAVLELPDLDSQIRDAVRDLMALGDAQESDFSKVKELLDLKAAALREPFLEKVRRIKESA